ncbi:hypothetical protein QCA50_001671 [Cerrena zonata]|uniref:MIT domain-containing protein n=1 Tax=Cerrena zonata TaxID=2478898 RepID=A0AAW0GMQ3_9APHY
MELEYETAPLVIGTKSRDWQTTHTLAGPSSSAGNTSPAFVSRRRSAIAHAPPPGPPPSQPIPHVPMIISQHNDHDEPAASSSSSPHGSPTFQNALEPQPYIYTRPSASANLAAVAAFSQSRFANPSPIPTSTASSSTDNLSDPPPRSMLRTSTRSPVQTHEIVPDRLLLSPPETRPPAEKRPSSRSALTKALELARQAVQLDSRNDDPYGAVLAYSKSVALLSEVMERVMRGEDSSESHRRGSGRRRSVVAQEEEVRRLKSIHDTYADRMNILSLIYNIPLPVHSLSSGYASSSVSVSTVSTQPSSPSSTSPTSESSGTRSRTSSTSSRQSDDDFRGSSETERPRADESDGMLAIGTAMFSLDTSLSPRTPMGPSVHPYAASSAQSIPLSPTNSKSTVTSPPRPGRSRASSTLPPPPPPPTSLPPPAPASVIEPTLDISVSPSIRPHEPAIVGRTRGLSMSHKRTGSGSKLAPLKEDIDDRTVIESDFLTARPDLDENAARRNGSKNPNRDSHPLPPLPSPSPESATTPRNAVNGHDPVPHSPQYQTRARGSSNVSTRSEMAPTNHLPLINTSTTMGTIFQRRNKTSAPPSATGTSPTESSARLTASSLPASTANSLGMSGRSRASSQPGRRPSVAAHPLPPQTAGLSNGQPRKVSVPSKLNPNAPQITINTTALLSPPLVTGLSDITPLVPPPPIPHSNIPSAPMSPLPPTAPADPLRKPYHMMNLLRQTMTSKTGGYVTRRLHVPQEVWSQGGAKLGNIPEKVRVVEVLCSALEELQSWSAEYFGAGNVSSGMALGIGSIGKKEGDLWATKLEEFSSVCDGVVGNFGKKLGVGEGFVTKKSSGVVAWGGKLTRQLDKFTNGKNLDSPAMYVQGLAKLFSQAQVLDEHTRAILMIPPAPLYASFSPELKTNIENKLRHASEFFAKVVLTFVIRDMALLLDKYVKKCEKWLAE